MKSTANKDEFANLRYYLKYLLLQCSMENIFKVLEYYES